MIQSNLQTQSQNQPSQSLPQQYQMIQVYRSQGRAAQIPPRQIQQPIEKKVRPLITVVDLIHKQIPLLTREEVNKYFPKKTFGSFHSTFSQTSYTILYSFSKANRTLGAQFVWMILMLKLIVASSTVNIFFTVLALDLG